MKKNGLRKDIKLEPYDISTMYAYAPPSGGGAQVPSHYAQSPTYLPAVHHHHHHSPHPVAGPSSGLPSTSSISSIGAAVAGGIATMVAPAQHIHHQHDLANIGNHGAAMHHMEPHITELTAQSKRRR